ncbi:MAG: hypothetical protein AB7P03_17445 [Kofleriaceae bacterium]
MTIRLFATALMVILFGCNDKPKGPPAPSLDTPQPPTTQTYPSAPPPANPISLKFDFSSPDKVYGFDYTQQMETKFGAPGGAGEPDSIKLDAAGTVIVRGTAQGKGALTLTIDRATVNGRTMPSPGGAANEMTINELAETGGWNGTPDERTALLLMLFPLSAKPLRPGESADHPMAFPIAHGGSNLVITGTITNTLTGFVVIGGKVCARIDSVMDVSKLDLPKGMEGKYSGSLVGKSVTYFDVDSHQFVSGTSSVAMNTMMDGTSASLTTTIQWAYSAAKTKAAAQ